MRFDVKFVPRSFARNVGILGPGTVYLDETGIVIEGDFTRFYLPVLQRVLRRIICANGVRTIPFSRIVKYVEPSFWRGRNHRVTYSLPDRSRRTVNFRMRSRRKSNNAEFVTRFAEFRTAALTFLPR